MSEIKEKKRKKECIALLCVSHCVYAYDVWSHEVEHICQIGRLLAVTYGYFTEDTTKELLHAEDYFAMTPYT